MGNNEFAPVNIKIVTAEDLSQTPTLKKIEQQSSNIGVVERIDTVLSTATDVIDAVGNKNLYKVTVPDGYCLTDLIESGKRDGSLRALVKDSKGHLNGDVSLKLNGVNATQIASMGLGAMAMVVGQAYMTEINNSLHSIDSKLDTVIAMMTAEKKAKLKNAIDIARSYMQLHDDYLNKPSEARQAARNEIEARYNDVGEVIDWLSESLIDIEKRASEAKATEKTLSALLEELHQCEEQFNLSLHALATLAMTRMYYDGSLDERSALIERQRIEQKTQQFQQERQKLMGIVELKIGALKGAPVALPQESEGKNIFKRLTSQTPRAAAKQQLLETKVSMQTELRNSTQILKKSSESSVAGINRISSANQAVRCVLTDGTTNCWIAGDLPESK
ncbi:MAG TPA: hypothetical protein OIM20_04530 [Eggerthellaceae bacterium]|nr:hypothetical protein [Eggerthellaceae bacterium]